MRERPRPLTGVRVPALRSCFARYIYAALLPQGGFWKFWGSNRPKASPGPPWRETAVVVPPPHPHPHCIFLFLGFQLPLVNLSLETLNGIFQK